MAEKQVFLGCDNELVVASDTTATAGVVHIGTSAIPRDLGLTAGRYGVVTRFTSPALSGYAQGYYLRLALTGAAGSGNAFRSYMNVDANCVNARAAHISLDFAATAGGSECSGLGVALEATLHIPDIASWAPTGTLAGLKVAIHADGAASDPAGLTELSCIRIDSQGNATGMADVDTDACIFSINGFTAAADAAHAVSSKSLTEFPASSIAFAVNVDGARYYIPAVIAAELN